LSPYTIVNPTSPFIPNGAFITLGCIKGQIYGNNQLQCVNGQLQGAYGECGRCDPGQMPPLPPNSILSPDNTPLPTLIPNGSSIAIWCYNGYKISGNYAIQCVDTQYQGNWGTCDSCPPLTCASVNAQCGDIQDECVNFLNCGLCSAPNTVCRNNACVPCIPGTCAMYGVSCGSMTDGCDHLVNCGNCPLNSKCLYGSCVKQTTPPPYGAPRPVVPRTIY
jgi:hypothetical protein